MPTMSRMTDKLPMPVMYSVRRPHRVINNHDLQRIVLAFKPGILYVENNTHSKVPIKAKPLAPKLRWNDEAVGRPAEVKK